MANDENPEVAETDWADLRAKAAKLNISLSEYQQRERQKKARSDKKRTQADARRANDGRT